MKTKLFLAIALMTTLASCSSDPSTSTGSSTTPDTSVTASSDSNQADFFWQLGIISAERTLDLSNTQSFTLYGGDIEDVDYHATASDGHEFLIIELSVDKASAGGNPFDWAQLYVQDSDGNQYFRMENDKFLEDYNLPRLNGTPLTLGGNEGFICIEIPTSASGLQLVHATDEGENTLKINT